MGEVMAFFVFFLYYLNLVLACLLNAISKYMLPQRDACVGPLPFYSYLMHGVLVICHVRFPTLMSYIS